MDMPLMTIARAADLVGLGHRVARYWVQDGWIGWPADKIAAVAGATTLLTKRSVIAMGIAAELVRLGLHAQMACKAARTFTDLGDEKRNPGALFSKNITVLIAYATGEANVLPADK